MNDNESWLDLKYLAFYGCNCICSSLGHESGRGLTIMGHNWLMPLSFPVKNAERVNLALIFWKTKNLRVICSLQNINYED